MRIGLVSTWLHRGAAYVTINYAKLLRFNHDIYVYARGGEYFDSTLSLDGVSVYEGYRVNGKDGILLSDFNKWVYENKIDLIIWNEQRDLSVLCKI